MPYIEKDFPIEEIDEIAQKEANARKPVYHIHKWWARRVSSVFRAMILATFFEEDPMNYFYRKVALRNKEGKPPVILDPFMGGGTPVVEGVKLGAKVVGVEINPLAWFITKKELEPVDVKKVNEEFDKLERKVGEEIRGFYKTRCLKGHEADLMYCFWVKKVKCENCGEEVPLYNSFRITKKGKEVTVFCPSCGNVFTSTEGLKEKLLCRYCGSEFSPSGGYSKGTHYKCPYCQYTGDILKTIHKTEKPLATEMFAVEYYCPICEKRGYKKAEKVDKDLFEKVKKIFEERRDKLLFPMTEIPKEGRGDPRPISHGYKHFYQMFNERQLLCLSTLLEAILDIEDEMVREFFLITFSDCLNANNMFCKYNAPAQKLEPLFGYHAFWPPGMPIENNVWGTELGRGSFTKYFEKGKRALKYIHKPYETKIVNKRRSDGSGFVERKKVEILNSRIDGQLAENFSELLKDDNKNVLLNCQTSEDLTLIGSTSVDAIITDPPYYSNVMYGELSDFFYVWLRIGLKDRYPEAFKNPVTKKDREILVNKAVGKTSSFFIESMKRVFKECYRVLKEDGIMAFTFHHKETKAWGAVLEALLDSGFYISATYPIHSETRSGVHRYGIRYDSIIVCRKRTEWKLRKVPWAIFEAQLLDKIEKDIDRLLERHPDLNVEDIFVIGMGHALQIYSENYGGLMKNGEVLDVDKALETIGGTVFDILLRKVLAKTPDVDRISRIYATVFAGLEGVSLDTINKITRHGGIETDVFESEHLLKKAKKNLMKIVSEKERKNHIQRKIERGIPLMYVDAAHLLRTARSERARLNETLQAIIESGIDKETLSGYLHFLAERTKDVEWKRLEKALQSIEISTLEKYM